MENREECVIFKQEYGNELLVNQRYVGIRTKEDGMMSFNLRVPKDQINNIETFFNITLVYIYSIDILKFINKYVDKYTK